MPRNSSGVYSLPVASYVSGTTIKSADMNTNLSDIGTALTQSMATTGVSTMTGALIAFAGTQAAPGITWAGDLGTGFYLAGSHQIGMVTNGAVVALFNSDQSINWKGNQVFQGTAMTVANAVTFNGTITTNATTTIKALFAFGAGGSFDSTSVFAASGPSHTIGTVPDPGSVAGTSRFLREDSTWNAPAAAKGEVQLTLSGANLLLLPYNGNILFVNGAGVVVPDVGVTLAIGAAIANTFYYIYAFVNSGTLTLEFSTTAPTAGAGVGIKIKTGDATRTLVGAAYTDSPAAWRDQAGKRWVLSWFNRRRKSGATFFTADRTNSGAAYSEVNTEIRNQFISWGEEEVIWSATGAVANNTAGQTCSTSVGFDGTTPETECRMKEVSAGDNQVTFGLMSSKSGLTEAAVHYLTLLAKQSANTATYTGAAQPCAITIAING